MRESKSKLLMFIYLSTLCLILGGLASINASAEESQNALGEEYKLYIFKDRGKVTDIRWVDSKNDAYLAVSPRLLEIAKKSTKGRSNFIFSSDITSHAAILVPREMSLEGKSGIVILKPGKVSRSISIPKYPIKASLHSDGLWFYYFDIENNHYVLSFYSVAQNKVVPVARSIDAEKMLRIEFGPKFASVFFKNDTVEQYYPNGGKGSTRTVAKEIDSIAKNILEAFKAKDLTKTVLEEDVILSSWLEKEAEDIEDVLLGSTRGPQSVLIVGQGENRGLVNLISKRIALGKVSGLKDYKVVSIDPSRFGPDGFVGKDAGKIVEVMDALAGKSLILFIPSIHQLLRLGGDPSTVDKKITTALKEYLNRGDIKIIGTTTQVQQAGTLSQDDEFLRSFEIKRIRQPSPSELKDNLIQRAEEIEKRLNVKFEERALDALAEYSYRHLRNQSEPEIEIRGMEKLASLRVKENDSRPINMEDARVWVGHESNRPSLTDDKLLNFSKPEKFYPALSKVIGHEHVLETVRGAISRLASGDRRLLRPVQKAQGLEVIMLLGPSGVGKTFVPKQLMKALKKEGIKWCFDEGTWIVNGNEYSGEHGDFGIFGPYAGYRDSEKQFIYNNMMRCSEGVWLFDEFDKQNPNVTEKMMNLLDEGLVPTSVDQSTSFPFRGIIFLAANFGARGTEQGEDTEDEHIINQLIKHFTLYYTDDYTFAKRDKALWKVVESTAKKYFVDKGTGIAWKRPTNKEEMHVLLRKLSDLVVAELGEIGAKFSDQDSRRSGIIEVIPHWTRANLKKLIAVTTKGEASSFEEEFGSQVEFSKAAIDHFDKELWEQDGGLAVFKKGASAFLVTRIWKSVLTRLSDLGNDKSHHGKKWCVDYKSKLSIRVVSNEDKKGCNF